MELIRGQHNLRPRHRGCVATIGNFDGVHRGHRAILDQLAGVAARLGLPTTVITFEPQPQEYFAPERVPARLTRLREKLLALEALGVDRVLCLRFDAALAAMPADAFIQRLLIDGLAVRHLVVGDDFRFGQGRSGDFALLRRAGAAHGFAVVDTDTHTVDGLRVSSTRVRQALQEGDHETATLLLGRPYAMCGRVAHGDKRGRTLGFPTANVHLHRQLTPVLGVHAVEVHGVAARPLPGVANVGRRPTVGGLRDQLEVHLLGFDGDIYGRHVQVDFLHYLRAEMRFGSLDALRDQIRLDTAAAHAYFAERARGAAPC